MVFKVPHNRCQPMRWSLGVIIGETHIFRCCYVQPGIQSCYQSWFFHEDLRKSGVLSSKGCNDIPRLAISRPANTEHRKIPELLRA
jgi:hypothetical protein